MMPGHLPDVLFWQVNSMVPAQWFVTTDVLELRRPCYTVLWTQSYMLDVKKLWES